jgi:hypothetical protein
MQLICLLQTSEISVFICLLVIIVYNAVSKLRSKVSHKRMFTLCYSSFIERAFSSTKLPVVNLFFLMRLHHIRSNLLQLMQESRCLDTNIMYNNVYEILIHLR